MISDGIEGHTVPMGGGLSHFDGSTWSTYTSDNGLSSDLVDSMAVAPDGSVWFGISGGFTKYDGRVWTNYVHPGDLNYGSEMIAIGHDGSLWYNAKDGVARYDGQRIVIYSDNSGLINYNCYGCIRSIAIAPKDTVWIGTADGASVLSLTP